MVDSTSPSTRAVGFWSAVLATAFSLLYVIGQIAEWMGLMGSGGGAHNASTPFGLMVLLTPSLFLGSSFLVLMVSVHQLSSPDRKVWSHAAVAFATAYTVLISINYFVQLTWVVPRLAAGRTQGIEPFLFEPFDSFLYSVDILGYSFMSVAMPEARLRRSMPTPVTGEPGAVAVQVDSPAVSRSQECGHWRHALAGQFRRR